MPGGGGWSRRAPPSVRALATPALATGVRSGAEPSTWGSDVVSRGVVSELSWRVGHPDGVGELLGVGESAHTCAHVHTRTHTCRTHTRAHTGAASGWRARSRLTGVPIGTEQGLPADTSRVFCRNSGPAAGWGAEVTSVCRSGS